MMAVSGIFLMFLCVYIYIFDIFFNFSCKVNCFQMQYCIRHIFRGVFIFANFASRVLFANLTTRENIYLRSGPTHECDCVRNTVHSARAREDRYFCLLKMSDFNHSRKCLEVPIREKFDSRNIWRIQYLNIIQIKIIYQCLQCYSYNFLICYYCMILNLKMWRKKTNSMVFHSSDFFGLGSKLL